MATNGLPAVKVARPSKWGNMFVVGVDGTAEECVTKYRKFICFDTGRPIPGSEKLRDKNLACFCKIGEPCHADVLLELASTEQPE
jgi:hypothetical protein